MYTGGKIHLSSRKKNERLARKNRWKEFVEPPLLLFAVFFCVLPNNNIAVRLKGKNVLKHTARIHITEIKTHECCGRVFMNGKLLHDDDLVRAMMAGKKEHFSVHILRRNKLSPVVSQL